MQVFDFQLQLLRHIFEQEEVAQNLLHPHWATYDSLRALTDQSPGD